MRHRNRNLCGKLVEVLEVNVRRASGKGVSNLACAEFCFQIFDLWRNFLGFKIFLLGGSYVGFLKFGGWRRALVLWRKGISGYDDFWQKKKKKKKTKLFRNSLNILEVDVRSGLLGEQDLAYDDSRQEHNADYCTCITPVGHCRNIQRLILKPISVQV